MGDTFFRKLPCILTKEEAGEKAEEASRLGIQIEAEEEKQKASAREFSSRLKGLRATRKELDKQATTRKVSREVECRVVVEDGRRVVKRLDTGEEDTTPGQQSLPMPEGKKKPPAKVSTGEEVTPTKASKKHVEPPPGMKNLREERAKRDAAKKGGKGK